MNELHDLLDGATDLVQRPDLAVTALAAAKRRRRMRRTVLATGAAAILVVGGAWATQLNQRPSDSAPVVTPPSPTASSNPPSLTDLSQSPWNPQDVDALAPAAASVAPGLSDVIDPPSTAPSLADNPIGAAVLCLQAEDALLLMTPDGEWRSVPPRTPDSHGGVLSADGTRLAVATADGLDVWSLPTGERTSLPSPTSQTMPDYWSWAWIDESTLLIDDASGGGWTVDASSGEATHVAYPGDTLSWTIDSDGAVVESSDFGITPELVDWAGPEPRRVNVGRSGLGIGRVSALQANSDTIVGVSGGKITTIDRTTLEPTHILPMLDQEDNYGDGKVPVVALLNDGTVLLQVPVFGETFSWRLVAWDPQSTKIARVARGSGVVPTSYATGLLG